MKILVIQLARLSDIYLSWPAVRALKRKYQEACIDVLVEKKNEEAISQLEVISEVIGWDSETILSPLCSDSGDEEESLLRLRRSLASLRQKQYDLIINLSFTPLSSYLVNAIATEASQILGYSRFEDGFLKICGEASAYFHAQTGFDRDNRKHFAEIFADVAGVEITDSDFGFSKDQYLPLSVSIQQNAPFLVCQFEAVDSLRAYEIHKWQGIVSGLLRKWEGQVVLIGDAVNRAASEQLAALIDSPRLVNLTGETHLGDLPGLIDQAELVIAGDGLAIAIAAHTNTPCLNFSFCYFNFWETGPRSQGSRVIWTEFPEDLASDRVVEEALRILQKEPAKGPVAEVSPGIPYYKLSGYPDWSFAWDLIEAIYDQGPVPELKLPSQYQSLSQIGEMNKVALQQLETLAKKPGDKTASMILDRVDEVIGAISELEPTFGPLVRWYQTEKSRISPGPVEELIRATVSVHDKLEKMLDRFPASALAPENVQSLGGLRANR